MLEEIENLRSDLAKQASNMKDSKKKANKLQTEINHLHDELRSMRLENESYKMFLSGEHKTLLVKDKLMQ